MKDKSDNFRIIKKDLPDLPMRLLIIGKSGSGKSSIIGNLLCIHYKNDISPEDIFIFSGSLEGDLKLKTMIEHLDIPKINLFDKFDEDILKELYSLLQDDFNESIEEKKKPSHKLIIFDDLSFTGSLKGRKNENMINKIFMNGRKFNINVIVTAQKYTDISTGARENCTAMILFKSSNKQIEVIEQDMNYLENKSKFMKMIKNHTETNHDFILFDFSKDKPYRNMEGKHICLCNDESKCGGVKHS
jgi:GTPase SAR1 family protein